MGESFVRGQKLFRADLASIPLLASVTHRIMDSLLYTCHKTLVTNAALEAFGSSVHDSLVRPVNLLRKNLQSCRQYSSGLCVTWRFLNNFFLMPSGRDFQLMSFPHSGKGHNSLYFTILLIASQFSLHTVHPKHTVS